MMSLRLLGILAVCGAACAAPAGEFTLKDAPGDHLDVLEDGKLAARYMYAHDTSSQQRHEETYKPYLHVFDAAGEKPITKGPGGLFPHHRGIFIGWMKIGFEGQTFDRWHMKGGDIVHQKFSGEKTGKDFATFTSRTVWMDADERPLLEEERTFIFHREQPPLRLAIDVASKLYAVRGDVTLDGDPEHAGIQFRPASGIVTSETVYVFPREHADAHKDVDYPWVGESYTLDGRRLSVVIVNHPDNPRNTRFSAYRDYGRFGAFPVAKIASGDSKTFRYRFLVADGEMPSAEVIQRQADQFTGAMDTPVPHTTVVRAETSKPAKPKPPKTKSKS